MPLDPGVDPERFDPHDFLLLVGHAAGHVHHVDDAGDGVRAGRFLPTAVLFVLPDRHHEGVVGVVRARGNLPLEGPLVRPLEVPQALRADVADGRILVLLGDDVLLALRFDAGQGEFLAEDFGEFFQRQVDFKNVPTRLVAGLRVAVLARLGERLAGLTVADADAAGTFVAVAELRVVDARHGDRDQVVPLFADHLAAADVLRQVRLDLPADDLAEPLQVLVDLLSHGGASGSWLPNFYLNSTGRTRPTGRGIDEFTG
jgi:hypothetical protein